MSGGNMSNMLKQAQKMQQDLLKAQEELEEKNVEASVGGGAVTVTVSGKKELVSIKIQPDVIDPEDAEMLEDLICAAVNEGLRKADELASSAMGRITSGMNLPGMF
mgnify:CR=1 FL=1